MAEYQVIEVETDQDLNQFSQYLWQQGVGHRIVSTAGKKVLLVGNEQDAMQVALAYKSLQEGEMQWPDKPQLSAVAKPTGRQFFSLFPVTLLTIVLSIIGYLLVRFDSILGIAGQLSFFDFEQVGNNINFTLPKEQFWRLITPVFLHFSVMHIVFNMLWLWDLGRRIEIVQGSLRLLGISLIIGLGSNIAQAKYAEAAVFGGMSGIIYGLLGYAWVWGILVPQKSMHIPNPVVIFMMAWLLLCMMGFTQLLGLGAVANAAHLGGLLMGLFIGVAACLIERR